MLKSKNSFKRTISLFLSAVMIFCISAFAATPTTVSAASKRSKAIKAYKKYIKKERVSYNEFSLVYIDKDNIPELLLKSGSLVDVYSYYGKKVRATGFGANLNKEYNEKFNYYKKTGVFHTSFNGLGEWSDSYPKLSKGKIKYPYVFSCGNMASSKITYKKVIKNKKSVIISKAKYKKWIKKNTKGKKASHAKFHPNTNSGIKKYCK
jgi:hypothetical protein